MDQQVQKVKIAKIKIRKPKPEERTFNRKMAEAIAKSVEQDGQLSPVLLRAIPNEPGYYENIAGLHRIYAIGTILKWDEIDAYVIECDDTSLQMKTIAENAFRSPLTKEQFFAAIATWKKHYEAASQYKQGQAGGKAKAAKETGQVDDDDDNPLEAFGPHADKPTPPPPGVANPLTSPPAEAHVNIPSSPAVEGTKPTKGKKGTKPAAPEAEVAKPLSFRAMIQAAFGSSQTVAIEMVKVAEALEKLTDEERKVVFPEDATKAAGKTDLAKLASLPDNLRSNAIKLRAAGMAWEEAIAEQTKAVKAAKAADPNAPKSEDDLTDEEWLTTHCPTPLLKLKKKDVFKSDALAYRRWAKKRRKLQKDANNFLAECKNDKTMKPGPYQTILSRAFRAKAPNDWLICSSCQGTGLKKDSNEACGTCNGAAYKVTVEPI